MSVGLWLNSRVKLHFLKEQFAEIYACIFFDSLEAGQKAFEKGEVSIYLWERENGVMVQKENTYRIFPYPLFLRDLLSYLSSMSEEKVYTIGPYLFSPSKRLLECSKGKSKKDRDVIQLREKEADLLSFLLKAPNHSASRHTLLKHIWGVRPGMETRTLETHVYQLRQKIEPTPQHPQFLISIEDGYALRISS